MNRSLDTKKLILFLILPIALFLMGAEWVEKPVASLDTTVGTWKGSGISAEGYRYDVEYVFRKDGSFDAWAGGKSWSKKIQMPAGTMHINGGKLEYKNEKGIPRTGVLYEGAKGRRKIVFQGEEGGNWDVSPAKK